MSSAEHMRAIAKRPRPGRKGAARRLVEFAIAKVGQFRRFHDLVTWLRMHFDGTDDEPRVDVEPACRVRREGAGWAGSFAHEQWGTITAGALHAAWKKARRAPAYRRGTKPPRMPPAELRAWVRSVLEQRPELLAAKWVGPFVDAVASGAGDVLVERCTIRSWVTFAGTATKVARPGGGFAIANLPGRRVRRWTGELVFGDGRRATPRMLEAAFHTVQTEHGCGPADRRAARARERADRHDSVTGYR